MKYGGHSGRAFGRDVIRFLIAGCINTGFTIIVYQILLFWVSSSIAYALSWFCGLAFIATVYPSRVFVGGRSSASARLQLIISYCAIFVIGLALMRLMESAAIPARIAIFLTVGTTTLMNFVVGRFLLRYLKG